MRDALDLDVLDLLEAPGQAVIITAGTIHQDRDARFERACHLYPDARVEMDEDGNIILTPGNSEDSAYRSGEAFGQLRDWTNRDGMGRAFDSSAIFNLPSGAKRSPDASWVAKETLQREGKATRTITKTRHVPVFLIEVASPSDTLSQQQEKCRKWIEAGVQEAILLYPKTRAAYVFLASTDGMLEIPDAVKVRSTLLIGFVLNCAPIWEELTA